MKLRSTLVACLAIATLSAYAEKTVARPKITGISHLAVYANDPIKTADYYERIVGCRKLADFEDHPGVRYAVTPLQYVEVLPLPASAGVDRLDHIAFQTSSVEAMERYLLSKGVPVPNPPHTSSTGVRWLEVKDFEGNRVQFVEDRKAAGDRKAAEAEAVAAPGGKLVGHHIIHIGMAIRNRSEADQFYRDVLGFRPYWHGGMDPEKTDWVAMQVPDGTDWLEYMLTSGQSGGGIPFRISQKSLGVLNHLSIGVPSMAAAVSELKSQKRVGPEGTGPQIGKDGKWQFNDFDPDETRLEYMEFTPVQKPCCSDFTGPHPSAGTE